MLPGAVDKEISCFGDHIRLSWGSQNHFRQNYGPEAAWILYRLIRSRRQTDMHGVIEYVYTSAIDKFQHHVGNLESVTL